MEKKKKTLTIALGKKKEKEFDKEKVNDIHISNHVFQNNKKKIYQKIIKFHLQ